MRYLPVIQMRGTLVLCQTVEIENGWKWMSTVQTANAILEMKVCTGFECISRTV